MLINRFFEDNYTNIKKKKTFSESINYKIILIILIMFLIIFFFIFKPKYLMSSAKFDYFNKLLINYNLKIKNIEITGANHLKKDDIIKIIQSYNNKNIFSVNLKNIYNEINQNEWVKETSIKIIYPDTIKILLTEKEPIAIWQNKNGNNLITKRGEVISQPILYNFNSRLPIIIGQNAHKNIDSILKILNTNINFARNIWSLTFVNERRWDIHFNQGLTIRLPSINVKEAWEKIISLHEKFNILNLGLTEIDLRNPSQILGKINVDKKLIFKKKNS